MKKHIWIESDDWPTGEWNPEDINVDVIVTFANREQWIASFLSIKTFKPCVKEFTVMIYRITLNYKK